MYSLQVFAGSILLFPASGRFLYGVHKGYLYLLSFLLVGGLEESISEAGALPDCLSLKRYMPSKPPIQILYSHGRGE